MSEYDGKDGTGMRVFVTTPAGNIGGRVLARLVESGTATSTLALDTDVERLPAAVRAATDVHVGTLSDPEDVIAASRGARAMLLVTPPVFGDDDAVGVTNGFVANALAAIEANGINRVVFVSTEGAGSSTAGLVRASHDAEQRLAQAAPHVRALRPGPLMENLLHEVAPIAEGELPLVADDATPMRLIAAGDVGDVAADLLLDTAWSGFEGIPMSGPEALTAPAVAECLAAVLGRKIAFVPITAAQLAEEMVKFGIAPGAARAFSEVVAAAWEEGYDPGPDPLVTKTSLEEFATAKLAPALAAYEAADG